MILLSIILIMCLVWLLRKFCWPCKRCKLSDDTLDGSSLDVEEGQNYSLEESELSDSTNEPSEGPSGYENLEENKDHPFCMDNDSTESTCGYVSLLLGTYVSIKLTTTKTISKDDKHLENSNRNEKNVSSSLQSGDNDLLPPCVACLKVHRDMYNDMSYGLAVEAFKYFTKSEFKLMNTSRKQFCGSNVEKVSNLYSITCERSKLLSFLKFITVCDEDIRAIDIGYPNTSRAPIHPKVLYTGIYTTPALEEENDLLNNAFKIMTSLECFRSLVQFNFRKIPPNLRHLYIPEIFDAFELKNQGKLEILGLYSNKKPNIESSLFVSPNKKFFSKLSINCCGMDYEDFECFNLMTNLSVMKLWSIDFEGERCLSFLHYLNKLEELSIEVFPHNSKKLELMLYDVCIKGLKVFEITTNNGDLGVNLIGQTMQNLAPNLEALKLMTAKFPSRKLLKYIKSSRVKYLEIDNSSESSEVPKTVLILLYELHENYGINLVFSETKFSTKSVDYYESTFKERLDRLQRECKKMYSRDTCQCTATFS